MNANAAPNTPTTIVALTKEERLHEALQQWITKFEETEQKYNESLRVLEHYYEELRRVRINVDPNNPKASPQYKKVHKRVQEEINKAFKKTLENNPHMAEFAKCCAVSEITGSLTQQDKNDYWWGAWLAAKQACDYAEKAADKMVQESVVARNNAAEIFAKIHCETGCTTPIPIMFNSLKSK
jgi:hypothetical protein